jgi:hypothetical protein
MSQCIVLAVPEAITRLVLVGWLGLKDVARLDCAFCITKLRAAFQAVAFGQLTTYCMPPEAEYERSAQWLIARSVKVDGIWMCNMLLDNSALRHKFLAQQMDLRWISITEGAYDLEGVIADVCTICSTLRELKCFGSSLVPPKWDRWVPVLTAACQKLQRLELNSVACTSEGLDKALKLCVNLRALKIDGFAYVAPKAVAIPSLECLQLRRLSVPDSVMIEIGKKCKALHTLLVFDGYVHELFPFTEVGVRAVLEGCPLLRVTDAEYAEGISSELRVELAKRHNYKELYFDGWKGVDNVLVQAILAVSPALERLRFVGCSWLTDTTLAVCGQHCPLLTSFQTAQNRTVTTEGVMRLIKPGSRLRRIVLTDNRQLRDDVVRAIAQHCPLMEVCVLANYVATEASVVTLAKGCPKLKIVGLSSTNISEAGFTALITHCPALRSLTMRGFRDVTTDTLQAWRDRCSFT